MYYQIIFILLLVLIIFLIIRLFYAEKGKNNLKNTIPVYANELDTGDLLFVKYKNALGYFMRIVAGSSWTHTAMVYKDPIGNIYIMETANYSRPAYPHSNTKHKGVLFMPLQEWLLHNNKGKDVAVMKLRKPEEFDKDLLVKTFKKVNDRKLDTFNIKWSRLLFKKKYQEKQPLNENITCYELVVYLLQETGIAHTKYSPSSFFPKDIISGKLKMNPGFKYDRLAKINF